MGEIWRSHCFEMQSSRPVQESAQWLAMRFEKRSDDSDYVDKLTHAYSLNKARQRIGKAIDVDRWFVQNCERFTTVIVTYAAEKEIDETIAKHASKFYPSKLSKDRYNLLNRKLDCDKVAGVSLLAPENPENSTPHPDFTHAHSIYWLSGWPDCQPFEKLRDTFIKEVDGATATNNPLSEMIQVERYESSEIEIHPDVLRDDYETNRGARTSASGEIGANLPLLSARNELRKRETTAEDWTMADARDCPEWVEYWLGHLRLGIDGETETSGINRWSTFGEFKKYAQLMKDCRDGNENRTTENCESRGGCSNNKPNNSSRFTFTEGGVPSPFNFTDETDDSDESRFTFCEYE